MIFISIVKYILCIRTFLDVCLCETLRLSGRSLMKNDVSIRFLDVIDQMGIELGIEFLAGQRCGHTRNKPPLLATKAEATE